MAGRVYPSAPVMPMNYDYKMQGASVGPLPPPATYKKPYQRRHRGGLGGCCCCLFKSLCSILLGIILILGVAALVLWLVLRPIHEPHYDINDVQINSFSVNPTTSTITANFVYNITANNPNKKIGIKYDYINIDTSYDGQVFGSSTIPAFYQGHRNMTTLTSAFDVTDFAFPQSSESKLETLFQSGSNIPLLTQANAKVRVKIGRYTSFAVKIRVNCNVVVSTPTASKKATLVSKSCKLNRVR